jgi:PPOX class probable F420-dependent enzyme
VDRLEALARLAGKRIAHLATIWPDGRPHVVPITFAVVGGKIVTAIDQKPKRTRDLQRLANIEANRIASVLVDHYEEDWERLWWVRVDGPASIHHDGDLFEEGISALEGKYPQYSKRTPEGPLIAVSQDQVVSWDGSSG